MRRREFLSSMAAAVMAPITAHPVRAGPVLAFGSSSIGPAESVANAVVVGPSTVVVPSPVAETVDGGSVSCGDPSPVLSWAGDPWSWVLTGRCDVNGCETATIRDRPPITGERLLLRGRVAGMGNIEKTVVVVATDVPSPLESHDDGFIVTLDFTPSLRGAGLFDPGTGELVGVPVVPPTVGDVPQRTYAFSVVVRRENREETLRPALGMVVRPLRGASLVVDTVTDSPADRLGVGIGDVVVFPEGGNFPALIREAVYRSLVEGTEMRFVRIGPLGPEILTARPAPLRSRPFLV